MRFARWTPGAVILALIAGASAASAADLRLPRGGRVTVEFLDARDASPSTLSIVSPAVGVARSGCRAEDAVGLPGRRLLTARSDQRGCRVALDADPSTAGTQPFAAGAILSFRLCVQTNPSPACEHVWSSADASHLTSRTLSDRIVLRWEHQADGGGDFDDHVAVVRVEGDRDGDGLWDDWETSGIDADGDGDIDLTLPGARPDHKDVFVELDWMDCRLGGEACPAPLPGVPIHDHKPLFGAIEEVQAVYAAGPVGNPDGKTGVRLHVDVSNAIVHQEFLDLGCFQESSFDAVKAANFPALRRFAYHYGVFAHRQQELDRGNAGCAEVGGNDFLVTLAAWNAQSSGRQRLDAGSLLHELGHNLGLLHGGGDNVDQKPNYLSAMNHRYQYRGIPPHGVLDYSRRALPTLDELYVSEPQSLPEAVLYGCPDLERMCLSKPGAPINWNCTGGIQTDRYPLDLNRDRFCIRPLDLDLFTCAVPEERCQVDDDRMAVPQLDTGHREYADWYHDGDDRTCQIDADAPDQQLRAVGHVQPRYLRGFSDWDRLAYAFQLDTDHGTGSEVSVQEEIEPDHDETLGIVEFRSVPQGVVAPGATLTYITTVRNHTEEVIDDGVFEQQLPPGTTLEFCGGSPEGTCQPLGGGLVRVLLPALDGQQTATVELVVRVSPSTPEGTRLRTTAKVGEGRVIPDVECLPGEQYAPFSGVRAALSILVSSCPAGTNVIQGTAGSDILQGTAGRDCLLGGGGDDILTGGAGDDVLIGGEGRDQLDGGDGADVLRGGGGEDILAGGYGDDELDGGDGSDQCQGGGSPGDRFTSCEQQTARWDSRYFGCPVLTATPVAEACSAP